MIDLVLADDHPIVLDGLENLFGLHTDIEVKARCVDGEEALATVRDLQPDILVLDLRLPVMDGLEVLRELRGGSLPTQVVVLTAAVDDDEVIEAVQLGARGVIRKESASRDLVDCVRRVHAGGQCIDERYISRALESMVRRDAGVREAQKVLTPRELEVVRSVAKGLRNKAIAKELGITEGTVKIHLHNIYEKVGVRNRVGLTLYAQGKGLV